MLSKPPENDIFVTFDFNPRKVSIEYQREVIRKTLNRRKGLSDLSLRGEDYGLLVRALHTIGWLAVEKNKEAIDLVCELLSGDELDIPSKACLVSELRRIKNKRVINILLDTLRTTKSDNRTRGLIKETLKTIASTRKKELIGPLFDLLDSKNLSYKMKDKVYTVIEILSGTSDLYYEWI